MSKVSEFHKASYDHHDERATSHAVMMGHEDEGSPRHAFHKSGHESHTAMRNFHKICMEKATVDSMNKAAEGSVPASMEAYVRSILVKMLGDTLMPTAVSGIAPTRPGIIAVPRDGARANPGSVDLSKVPLEFQKMLDPSSWHEEERTLEK